jgi:hypothetical protein
VNDLATDLQDARQETKRLRDVVGDHFGTTNGAVVAAVGRFAQQTTSTLDMSNLAVVAAAGPFIDPGRLATLIDRLPRLEMILAAEVDGTALRPTFASILRQLRPEDRPEVVRDLITSTTVRMLELAPPDRLTEPAKDLVRTKLHKTLRRSAVASDEFKAAARSALLTPELGRIGLDRLADGDADATRCAPRHRRRRPSSGP